MTYAAVKDVDLFANKRAKMGSETAPLLPNAIDLLGYTAVAFAAGEAVGGIEGAFVAAGIAASVRIGVHTVKLIKYREPVYILAFTSMLFTGMPAFIGGMLLTDHLLHPAALVKGQTAHLAIAKVANGARIDSETGDVRSFRFFGLPGNKIGEIKATAEKAGSRGSCEIVHVTAPGFPGYKIAVRPLGARAYELCDKHFASSNFTYDQ